jgi:phospholipid transport system transporter-binding protein
MPREIAVASRNVKRVVKKRSNGKPRRPKQKSPVESRAAVPETVDPMTAAVNTVSASPAATGRIVLGETCTIHEAATLRAHLLEQAAHPGPYEIDGGAVQHIDTAGLQLVVAFALDCLERSIHYTWSSRSQALEEAIRTLGVGALLESPGGPSYSPGGA